MYWFERHLNIRTFQLGDSLSYQEFEKCVSLYLIKLVDYFTFNNTIVLIIDLRHIYLKCEILVKYIIVRLLLYLSKIFK